MESQRTVDAGQGSKCTGHKQITILCSGDSRAFPAACSRRGLEISRVRRNNISVLMSLIHEGHIIRYADLDMRGHLVAGYIIFMRREPPLSR
jgi:hypothetical protein